MTATQTPPETSGQISATAPIPSATLPQLHTSLGVDAILERLRTASKRGRLAGFSAPARAVPLADFQVNAFGTPFEADLIGRLHSDAPSTGPSTIRFELHQRRLGFWLFAAGLILSVWPGVLIVDSMIPGEWGWPTTWWWYVPLTALPIPWALRAVRRKSLQTTTASANEMIEKVRAEVDGTIA